MLTYTRLTCASQGVDDREQIPLLYQYQQTDQVMTPWLQEGQPFNVNLCQLHPEDDQHCTMSYVPETDTEQVTGMGGAGVVYQNTCVCLASSVHRVPTCWFWARVSATCHPCDIASDRHTFTRSDLNVRMWTTLLHMKGPEHLLPPLMYFIPCS